MENQAVETIDNEWLGLINQAKQQGLSIDEIRDFLNGENVSEQPNTYLEASYKE